MSLIVRTKTGSAASGAAMTITYDETAALDATHGHVLILRSQAGSSVDPVPTTPTGFVQARTPVIATSGGFTVRIDYFRARGNGTINSVSVAANTSVTRHGVLHAIDGITADDLGIANAAEHTTNANVTTRTITIAASTKSNVVDLAAVATSGTNGSTSGFAWTGDPVTGNGFPGTGSTNTFASRYTHVGAPAARTFTTTWTTAGLAVMSGIQVGGSTPAPTISRTDYDAVSIRDFRASTPTSGNTLTHTISPTTNVAEPNDGLFIIFQTEATQYFTVTSSDSGGGSVDTALTIPPHNAAISGLEILIKEGGALTPL